MKGSSDPCLITLYTHRQTQGYSRVASRVKERVKKERLAYRHNHSHKSEFRIQRKGCVIDPNMCANSLHEQRRMQPLSQLTAVK